MRHRLAPLASLLLVAVLAIAGCGGASGPPDPYQLLTESTKVAWDPIQINVGLKFTVAGESVNLDSRDMAFVIDGAHEKAGVHISIPAESLGVPAAALGSLGIDGDSLDFDLVYDSEALYLRSALMAPTLKMLLGPVGRLPRGDLTGWLKLGTKEELAALSALAGAGAAGTSSPPPALLSGGSKQAFEDAGVTLTTGATVEKRNGADAHHLTLAVDMSKLTSNPSFLQGAGTGSQAAQSLALLKALSVNGDIWVDAATKRVLEMDAHIGAASDPTQGGDVAITAVDPDGSVSLTAPTSSIEVPIGVLMSEMMKLVSGGSIS